MSGTTVLIVDNEADIVSFIRDALEDEGYEVLTAYSGAEALEQAKKKPQLVLLDIMMDDMDGFEVCQSIRPMLQGPIIFLSACQEEADRIKGLVVGGDDYLVKPFSLSELKARVHAHLRRERRKADNRETEILRFGDLTIDFNRRSVRIRGQEIQLTAKQFDIVWLLAINEGHVLSRDHIYEKVWGLEADGEDTTVTEHIKKIRSRFQDVSPEESYIRTVWGVGYKWT
ncbi:response regulator transcription factor [Paenibacillus sp. DYY-L-2]|uniref:response regulator transcription factor n=1 Tax=Paenibacillus sp. DYY-L-2 TaxID=3447013 RepID=UPI003F504274